MKIVAISDTHGFHPLLDPLPQGDILVHSGDFCNHGTELEGLAFLQWFAAQPHEHKVLVPGNHDIFLDPLCPRYSPGRYGNDARFLAGCAEAGIHYLVDAPAEIGGLRLYGTPWMPEFYQWAFMRPDEERERLVAPVAEAPIDVLVTHGPPHGLCDRVVHDGQHVGDRPLRAAVQANGRIRLLLCGHIHEGRGEAMLGATRVVNASTCNQHYDPDNLHPPVVAEL